MNYYLIRRSSDPKVLGNTTGIKQADIKKSGFLRPEEFDRILLDLGTNRYWEVHKFLAEAKYDIQYVELINDSHLTHFLSFGPFLINCPFMISEKVYSLLKRFNIYGATMFPSRVCKNDGQFVPYFLIHLSTIPFEFVDFEKSTFYEGDNLLGKRIQKTETLEDFTNKVAQGMRLKAEKLALRSSVDKFDLFVLPDREIIVSEELKVLLDRENANSGINFLPAYGVVPWVVVE